MPVTIGSNIASVRAIRGLDRATAQLSSTYERLSSGQRINRAVDDSAGLAIATSLNSRSQVFSQAIRNVNDGISLMRVAEGALTSLQDIVTRVGELAEQAANGSFAPRQRAALDKEADTLLREYNRIIRTTSFNGSAILDGSNDTTFLQHGIGIEQATRVALGESIGTLAGTGTFTVSGTLNTGGGQSRSVSFADVNSDGIADVITGDTALALVMLGNGNGTFRAGAQLSTGNNPSSVTSGDFNGDGKIDIITSNFYNSTVALFLGCGDGTFASRQTFAVSTNPNYVTSADVNGDGALDLVVTDNDGGLANGGVSVLIGNGNGTFRAGISSNLGTSNSYTMAVGDLNGDGIPDVAAGDLNSAIYFGIGRGDGTFVSIQNAPVGGFSKIAIQDVNDDGINDVIGANRTGNSVDVFIGNGNGTFQARTSYAVGGTPEGLAVFDVNGDGELDALTADYTSNTVSVLLGAGRGTFSPRTSYAVVSGPSGVAVADTNGDGVPDIVTNAKDTGLLNVLSGAADPDGRRNNLVTTVDLTNVLGARSALDWSYAQGAKISREIGMLGAYQSRIQSVLSVVSASKINTDAASSRISDADIALETSELVRQQILQKASQSILGQANLEPSLALRLLNAS